MVSITINKVYCKGCAICLSVCPKKVFVSSKKRNNYGSNMPEAQNTGACLVCGMCERLCPDGAINVEKTAEKEDAAIVAEKKDTAIVTEKEGAANEA